MTDLFISLGAWNWLIVGFILMALELLAPGIFLFWLGLAALLTGLATFAFAAVAALSWQAQFLLFAVLAVAAVPLWRRVARGGEAESTATNPFLNRRTDALVGREFTLERPIVGGVGSVRIDDTFWRVTGPDVPAGSRVKIVQADGVNLIVAAV
ncbi:NfeD family protein [Rhodopseudomonas palustris]|uniref:NfeD family protein n=1 Tax=Rhodopseudomonas palustris TaxID=1076 RepID=A0A418V355_RHOPL|nr:NfeD family protein [Rhodopseudomonas palustris]RJF70517.1 NfeD family protein [Rhodopseudomonas palustris]